MYQAFRIESTFSRTGKDLLHVEFKVAEPGRAFAIHPERLLANELELRILGTCIEVEEEDAEKHFNEGQLRLYHQLRSAEHSRWAATAGDQHFATIGMNSIRAAWTSTRLTFIRRFIEPLAPNDLFLIDVTGENAYVMSRRNFEDDFENVVRSRSYSEYGSYNYKETPSKAFRYIFR